MDTGRIEIREKVKDTELADYALGIKISFDKNGEIKIDQVWERK